MKLRTTSVVVIALVSIGAAVAQTQTPAQATPPPRPKPATAKPASTPVDDVIKLVKGGMSEAFIIKGLQKANKPVTLTPADMVKLKEAGVSENIMSAMMDPSSSPAPAPAVAAPAAAAPAATAAAKPVSTAADPAPSKPAPPAPAATTAASAGGPVTAASAGGATAPPGSASKKRVVIDPFDYSTVMTSVQAIFGNNQNIGKGIQAMMTTRVSQANKLIVVDRARVKETMAEQDFNASNRVKQGSGARIGRISGADVILAGDIVIFGRDDKKKGGAAGAVAGWCKLCGAVGGSKKEDRAVVAIDYRLIDAETTEIIASGEARGESKRKSTNWGAIAGAFGKGAGGAAVDMTSSNFAETIIGEATQDCVNKLAEILTQQALEMKKTVREVETSVADVNGSTVYIGSGANDGVSVGEVFEIFRVVREVKDPTTGEVLDRVTEKKGEATIITVRDKIAIGNYSGAPAAVKDVARKKVTAQQ